MQSSARQSFLTVNLYVFNISDMNYFSDPLRICESPFPSLLIPFFSYRFTYILLSPLLTHIHFLNSIFLNTLSPLPLPNRSTSLSLVHLSLSITVPPDFPVLPLFLPPISLVSAHPFPHWHIVIYLIC